MTAANDGMRARLLEFARSTRPLANALVVVGIVVVTVSVHYPGLTNSFNGDQIAYFAERNGSTSLWDGLRLYDYGVSRKYLRGDEALFRPLLFVWLAIGNHLFSYHCLHWNIANLCLHVAVVVLLYRLLAALQPGVFAVLFALLFAVMRPQVELVTNNHLGGYLWAFVFLLVALLALRKTTLPDEPSKTRWMTVYAVAMTFSSFFYECMAVFPLLASVYVLATLRRSHQAFPRGLMLMLWLPLIVYAAAYLFHCQRADRFSYVNNPNFQSIFEGGHLLDTPFNVLLMLFFWSIQTVLPSLLHTRAGDGGVLTTTLDWYGQPRLGMINAAVVAYWTTAFAGACSWRHLSQRLPLLGALLAMIVCYATIQSLGRPTSALLSYYLYFFCLVSVLLVYAALDFGRLVSSRKAFAVAALVALVLVNATLTHRFTTLVDLVNLRSAKYHADIRAFIAQHKHEPDFTFAIRGQPADADPQVQLKEGYADDATAPVRTNHVSEILYARYYRAERPKYTLDWQ